MIRHALPPASGRARRLLIDAHAHFHPRFNASLFLAAALLNLRRSAEHRGLGDGWGGVLVLTDGIGESGYPRLLEGAPAAGWQIVPRGPHVCDLVADSQTGRQRLTVVAGRQIVTRDELEVLALGAVESVTEGQPLEHTLLDLHGAGALAILPWGFGKWWGRRGRQLEALLRRPPAGLVPGRLFLGDNGGRLRWGRTPDLFAMAHAQGTRILSGSDPLPFRRQQWRVGSHGSWLDLDVGSPALTGSADAVMPWLIARLADPATRLHPFGHRRGLVGFAGDQLRMQWRKRVLGRRATRSEREPVEPDRAGGRP